MRWLALAILLANGLGLAVGQPSRLEKPDSDTRPKEIAQDVRSDCFGDPLPRIFDFVQLNRPNGIRGSFHLNRRYRQRPLRLGASRAARPVRVCLTDEREDAARFRPRRARC